MKKPRRNPGLVVSVGCSSEACSPVRLPAQQRACNRHVVCRDREQLRKHALPRSAFSLGHDRRSVAIAAHRVCASLDSDVRAMQAGVRRRLHVDVHKTAPRERAAIQSLLGGHGGDGRLIRSQLSDDSILPRVTQKRKNNLHLWISLVNSANCAFETKRASHFCETRKTSDPTRHQTFTTSAA